MSLNPITYIQITINISESNRLSSVFQANSSSLLWLRSRKMDAHERGYLKKVDAA